jgi:hypothetical protein
LGKNDYLGTCGRLLAQAEKSGQSSTTMHLVHAQLDLNKAHADRNPGSLAKVWGKVNTEQFLYGGENGKDHANSIMEQRKR